MARLKEHYLKAVKPKLKEKFGYANDLAVPRLDKIVVNIGMGREAVTDARRIQGAVKELSLITGQKPVVTKAKKSIASFKTREGMPLGVKVTLRASRMYEFLDRLVNVAMPRIRDFRGISPKSFDGRGNYAMGLKEQIIFPEINFDDVEQIRGMDIMICTTARTDKEARALLDEFNLPFTDR
jgi:large subunit ribosomal protein L5